MKIIYVTLLIAVAIIMISDVKAGGTSNETQPSQKTAVWTKLDTWKRRLKHLLQHLLDEILILGLNIVFNVGWEETYDYLFGNYGMLPIPYFPIGVMGG